MRIEIPFENLTSVLTALQRHPSAIVAGATAATLLGARDPHRGTGPVELIQIGGARSTTGVRVRREHVAPGEVIDAQVADNVRIRVTSPSRTAFDVARRLSTVDAVSTIEALIRQQGLTVEEVRHAAEQHPYARGLARLRAALSLVEPGARGGIETPVRIALLVAGLPAPVVGHCIVGDDGTLLGVTDLAWPEARCALLCDREPELAHLMTAVPLLDGWRMHRITPEDWDRDPDGVVERAGHLVRACRRRQGLDRAADRRPVLRGTRPRRRPPAAIPIFPDRSA